MIQLQSQTYYTYTSPTQPPGFMHANSNQTVKKYYVYQYINIKIYFVRQGGFLYAYAGGL